MSDIFALQSEIARTIAEQLQAKLSPREKAVIAPPPTADFTTYSLYLRARELVDNEWLYLLAKEKDPLKKREELLTEAIKRDPNFVLAYCELARVYDELHWKANDFSLEYRKRGDAAIDTATRLAPGQGEVHLARGFHFYKGYRQYAWARAEFVLAQKALPNEPRVYAYLGYLDRRQGHWTNADKNLQRVCELNPASIQARLELADIYLSEVRYTDARKLVSTIPTTGAWGDQVKQLLADIDFNEKADFLGNRALVPEKNEDGSVPLMNVVLALFARDPDRAERALAGVSAEELAPPRPRAYWSGAIARLRGDETTRRRVYTEARAEVAKAVQAEPENAELIGGLGLLDALIGNKEEALREGQRAIELLPLDYDAEIGMRMATTLVWINGWNGNKDRALTDLKRLVKIPEGPTYGELRCFPHYESLRGDPRFEEIVASLAPKE